MQLHRDYLLSMRGQLKADPTVMTAYALGILLLIKFEMNAKEVVFADYFSVADSLNSTKDYWDKVTSIDPKYGYLPKPAKSYLIVKEKKLMEVQNLFANSK